jgi:hypothetical protein
MDHREDISEIATGTKRWAVSSNGMTTHNRNINFENEIN